MTTLHLTNCWHSESGGIATLYRALLRQAETERRSIRLVIPGAEDGVEAHGRYGRIYRVRGWAPPFSPGYRLMMPHTYLLPWGRIRRIIVAERPGLVECCDKYTLNYLAALLRRGWLGIRGYRPVVVGLSCERMDENVASYLTASPLARRFCRWYMRWLYFPMFDHHIANSVRTADELKQVSEGHRIRRGAWVSPMGADCSLFTPARRRAAFRERLKARTGAPEGASILLYVGRLAPEKNTDLLMDTMRLLERRLPGEFHLLVAGEGPLRASLERACARDLPGAVWFLGHVRDRETLADIYANCDALLHPNPREPFGIAPLEAMASGLPLIGPDTGGITAYANDGNALLAKPDAECFAGRAAALRHDPALTARLREAGRATAERFDWSAVASSFFALYDELARVAHGSRAQPAIKPAFYSTYPVTRGPFGWNS
jgi:alpha-1,6-mannosyltransferase